MTTLTHVLWHNPITDLFAWLNRRDAQKIKRKKFKNLLDLEDKMLDDIGVTREEVQQAARLPLSQDAATELRRISLGRR